ncbi:hypothetical protein NECAME_12195 [Necator americanus]|uniref:Uncharacterized protein n=1 Tax=Necator americanus TaxID=51031 RepID=W2T0Z0_NECAM|nr:hypothetical protein NECAME_12195 [Necator americanus]ETN75670.1 hypothetical protein NECAME_12195 [Necator americanus]
MTKSKVEELFSLFFSSFRHPHPKVTGFTADYARNRVLQMRVDGYPETFPGPPLNADRISYIYLAVVVDLFAHIKPNNKPLKMRKYMTKKSDVATILMEQFAGVGFSGFPEVKRIEKQLFNMNILRGFSGRKGDPP